MYLLKYRIINDVYTTPHIDTDYHLVSTESFNFKDIINFLKRLIKQVATFFRKVFSWIKGKVMKYLEIIFKQKNSLIKFRDFCYKLPEENFNKLLNDSISKLKGLKTTSLESYDNNDFDIRDILKSGKITDTDYENIFTYLSKYKINYINFLIYNLPTSVNFSNNLLEIKDIVYGLIDSIKDNQKNPLGPGIIEFSEEKIIKTLRDVQGYIYNTPIDNIDQSIKSIDFFKGLDQLDEITKRSRGFTNDVERKLVGRIKTLEFMINRVTEGDINYDDYRKELLILQSAINLSTLPFSICLQYIRLVTIMKDNIKELDYISTNVQSDSPLLHLSFNDKLDSNGLLYPDLRRSGLYEYLPPRISFSPSIEQCAFAIQKQLLSVYEVYGYVDVYLYEGIPDRNTRYVVPELMRAAIHDYNETKEVAVVTPIKIKKIGKYRIYPNFNDFGGKDTYRDYDKIE